MENREMSNSNKLARGISILTGAGLGAGLMYYCDPQRGRRRRSLVQDQVRRAMSKTGKMTIAAGQDAMHRVYGRVVDVASSMTQRNVSDEILVERVRSKLGRYVSHPSSVEVSAKNGRVTLQGRILQSEVPAVLSAIHAVRGVQDIVNALEPHDEAGRISDLQGGVSRTGESPEWMQQSWSPATRTVASIAGVALMANCLIKRSPAAIAQGTLGFGLCARGISNTPTRRLFGFGRGRRGIDVQKTIIIDAPVEKVFRFLSDPQNYPRLTPTFKSVHTLGDGRYQKTLVGPAGLEIKMEEILTRRLWNELVAWKSGPNSQIKYQKAARFTALAPERTQVDFSLSYNPPGGIVGHSAAWLAGIDPKTLLDDVLMRAKSYLETGQLPHDVADDLPLRFQQASSEQGPVESSRNDGLL